jgi:large subunit ribosomal protein L9
VKVIFIEDVPNVARIGQTRDVANGYARNYLLPHKLAVVANSQAATAVEAKLQKIVKQRALEEAEMAELAKKLEGIEISLKAKVGESERLYGSVTGADIAEELGKSSGQEIDKRKIELDEPIRQLGTSDVTVRFTHDITAVIKVTVVSDEVTEEKSEKAEKKPKPKTKKKDKAAEATSEDSIEEAPAATDEAPTGDTKTEIEEPEAKIEEEFAAEIEEAENKEK